MSYIYVARCGDMLKIGRSNNPEARIKQLQTGNPMPVILEYTRERQDAKHLELYLHRQFQRHRVHGEWFDGTVLNVNDIVAKMFGFIEYDW